MTLSSKISCSLTKKKNEDKCAISNFLELQSDLLTGLLNTCVLVLESSHTLERDLTFNVTELSASFPTLTRPMTATVSLEIDWLMRAYLN